MPDLKLNKAAVERRITECAEAAHANINRAVKDAYADVAEVAQALPHVDSARLDKAEMAAVLEFSTGAGSYNQNGADLELHMNGHHAYTTVSTPLTSNTRYRAFVFIEKLP